MLVLAVQSPRPLHQKGGYPMETEFQILARWLPRINDSVRAGQGVPKELFTYVPRSKFNRNHIYKTFLALLDRENSLNDYWKKENIPPKRKRLFNFIDDLSNSEYYYIILYYFLTKRLYDREAKRVKEYISIKAKRIHQITALRRQFERLFNTAIEHAAKTGTGLMENLNRLKTTLLHQFNAEMGSPHVRDVMTRNSAVKKIDIIGKIDIIFQSFSEKGGTRERELGRLGEKLFSENILPKKSPHRPGDITTKQLIIFMHKYLLTTGISAYKANDLIAQTINYCFFPKTPLDRNKVKQRFTDQWIKKIERKVLTEQEFSP